MTTVIKKPLARQLHAHGKLPAIQQIPRSEGMALRDAVITRMKGFPFFSGFMFATSKAFRVMPNHIPYAAVYFVDESLSPDGLADSGEPRFHSLVQLGFSVMIENNDPERAELTLDDAYQVISRGLFKDPKLNNIYNKDFKIQGYTRGRRTHVFGHVGQNNELPVAELQFNLTIDLGAIIYEPLVPDMLETVHFKEVYPDDDPNRQPIIAEWDMDQ